MSPRQSSSSCILASISRDGDSPFDEEPLVSFFMQSPKVEDSATEVRIMSDVIEQVPVGLLRDFADSGNRADGDARMRFMRDDRVFEPCAAPAVSGRRHVGREAV